LIRGPSELVQHFADRGSSHRCKGADSHINDMVWPHRSPSGEERSILLVQ
jgi:hypothetical protein